MHYTTFECENCKRMLEVRILGICTGLGPPLVACGKCAASVDLGRKEWPSFRGFDFARFLAVSVAGIGFLALIGGLVGGISYPVPGVEWGKRVVDANPWFYIGAMAFALLGLCVQVYRVLTSIRRAGRGTSTPYVQSWKELQTNVQFKAIVVGLSLGVLGGTLSYWLS